MVLVEEPLRGRGLGKALLKHALDFLDRRGVASVRLDATPAGKPLYERLGFVEQFSLARYAGVPRPSAAVAGVADASAKHWQALAELDEAVTGTDRRRFLLQLFAGQPAGVRIVPGDGRPAGFLAARPGGRAVQVGPCLGSLPAGPLLLADALQRHAGQQVFVDVPLANEAATRLAEGAGLTAQRRLTRMCRGVPRCERVEWLWASSGPEKG
jgi:hypothetical protein